MEVVYLGGIMLSRIDRSKTSYDSSGHLKMYNKQGNFNEVLIKSEHCTI